MALNTLWHQRAAGNFDVTLGVGWGSLGREG